MFDSKIESVQIQKLNLDLECYLDLMQGKGIRLQSVESFDKKNEKVPDGLQSEFFGSDFSDDNSFAERYSCKCKKYIGKMYAGTVCEACNTTVEFNDSDLTRTGWIILDNYSVISPIYAAKLYDALGTSEGEKVLTKILTTYYDDDERSKFTDKEYEELKKHPFMKKGMIWLKDNLMEVLEYYEKKKTSKAKLFKELKDDIGDIFTSCIPVYTSLLRTELPGVKGNKIFKMKTNTKYQTMIRIVNYINKISSDKDDIDERMLTNINIQLAALQGKITEIFNITYKELTSKKGIIMSKVLGGRLNFSARNIIIPSSGQLRADEIEIGYLTFMELFRYEIINFYAKLQNCTLAEASNVWKKGVTHYNPTLYSIMQHMTADEECKKYLRVLINRNPSINYGSFLLMKIVKVKDDINDKTMTIPSNVLKTMGADLMSNQGRVEWRHSMLKLCERLTSGVSYSNN